MSFIGIAIGTVVGTGLAAGASVAIGGTVLAGGFGALAAGAGIGALAGGATTAATGGSEHVGGIFGIDSPVRKAVFGTGLPNRGDQGITDAQFAARLRACGTGRAGTIITSKLGLTEQATVEKKTLLGQ